AAYQIFHVTDRPGLLTRAVHGERLSPQRLVDERGDRPPVGRLHPRPERVEDPHDRGVHTAGAAVRHGRRLSEALRLVVDAAYAHRVDVAPVALRLWMYQRVAVRLRGGRE